MTLLMLVEKRDINIRKHELTLTEAEGIFGRDSVPLLTSETIL